MCGIAGKVVFDRDARPGRELLARMAASMVHRGPDEAGLETWPQAGFSHRRLSILDLEGGRQPLSNEDGTVWAMLNGEIYNFIELRRGLSSRGHRFRTQGDTEVLVHLWEEKGPDLLEDLRGMFALAIWDTGQRTLLLARDRLGKKPLYWAHPRGEAVVFASEAKALKEDPEVDRSVDPAAIDQYLALQYIPAPATAWKGIHKLPAAHRLLVRGRSVEVSRYWSLPSSTGEPRDRRAVISDLTASLDEAVGLRLRSDVPVGVFLSGGIDSSSIAASMAEQTERVHSCTVGFGDSRHDERAAAAEVAGALNFHHQEIGVDLEVEALVRRLPQVFDEPFADPAAVPTLALSRAAREHMKVALSGDGGDELFGGYWRLLAQRREARVRRAGLMGWAFRGGLGLVSPQHPALARLRLDPGSAYAAKHCDEFFRESARRAIRGPLLRESCDPAEVGRVFVDAWRRSHSPSEVGRALEVDLTTCLPEQLMTKVDRASMAFGLEVRSPLLDHCFVEAVCRLPIDRRVERFGQKRLLRALSRERLPHSALERRKHGFTVPLEGWLRGPLDELVTELLGPGPTLGGLVDRVELRRTVRSFRDGDARAARPVWSLLVLALWSRAEGL